MSPKDQAPEVAPSTVTDIADGHSAFGRLAERLSSHAAADEHGVPEGEIAHLLQETISTVTQHFLNEESLMKTFGYREREPARFHAHIESHADFSGDVCKLVCSADILRPDMLEKLAGMLVDFAVCHQRDHDDPFLDHVLDGQRAS